MSKSQDLEVYLYKYGLDKKPCIDIVPLLSPTTIAHVLKDLRNQYTKRSDTITTGDKPVIYAFTDGNCKKNGMKAARGGYGVFFTDDEESPLQKLNKTGLIIAEPTNQRAELTAIKHLFAILTENSDLFAEAQVVVCSDSLYAIQCINTWSKNWIKNNWKTSKGDDVKHKALIQDILNLYNQAITKMDVTFHHVYSHTNAPNDVNTVAYTVWMGNKRVDENINELLRKES